MKTPLLELARGGGGIHFEKKYSGALTVGMIEKAKSWEEGRSVEEGEKGKQGNWEEGDLQSMTAGPTAGGGGEKLATFITHNI